MVKETFKNYLLKPYFVCEDKASESKLKTSRQHVKRLITPNQNQNQTKPNQNTQKIRIKKQLKVIQKVSELCSTECKMMRMPLWIAVSFVMKRFQSFHRFHSAFVDLSEINMNEMC